MNLWILSDRESQGSLTMIERESMFFIYNINKKYIRYNCLSKDQILFDLWISTCTV